MSVLVTGGTGHLGQAVVAALSQRADVRFSYLRNDGAAKMLSAKDEVTGLRADLSVDDDLEGLIKAAAGSRAFVHCAALVPDEDATPEEAARAFAVNVTAPWRLSRGLAPEGAGVLNVVLCASVAGELMVRAPSLFAASQAALAGLARGLAHELGPRARVNVALFSILGGGISEGLDKENQRAFLAHSALRRVGTPEEAARVVAWLALDNTYATGTVVQATGGL